MKWGLLLCGMLVAGCNSSQPPVAEKYQGREETKKLEGASAVGYDGAAIRKNVDNSLNKTDDHARDLDKAQKNSSDEQK